MKILTAKYLDGRLQLPEGAIREGDTVTVLVQEHEGEVDLTEQEQSDLEEALAQADRGEGIDGWRLLRELS